jgi:hypothetical protein
MLIGRGQDPKTGPRQISNDYPTITGTNARVSLHGANHVQPLALLHQDL